MTRYYQAYHCPKCREDLLIKEKALICKNNHSFDIAKEGYVNLLLAHQKNSLSPGDTKEMIVARDKFLETGHYDFLIENIVLLDSLKNRLFQNVLDIGCGSGFYIHWLKNNMQAMRAVGSDVSKEAIKFAAKKYTMVDFVVNNSFNLSFKQSFFDLIVSIFSPFSSSEIERILAKSGLFVLVRPAENHLLELYEFFGIPRKNKRYPDFKKLKCIESKEIQGKISMSHEDLSLLIQMTPLFWKIKNLTFDAIRLSQITFNFVIHIYGRD